MGTPDRILEALKQLDPAEPAIETYVPRVTALPGGWDLPERMFTLLRAGQRVRALLHGSVGVGKSTELHRWERARWPEGILVLRYQMRRTQVDGDFVGLTRDALVRRCRADAAPSSQSTDFAALEKELGKRIVVLFDQLDRAPAEIASSLFGPGSWLCDDDMPSIVCTAPHDFLLLNGPAARDARWDQVWHLPPFDVGDQGDTPGAAALVEGLRQRIDRPVTFGDLRAPVPPLVDPGLLRRVVVSSGGVPRDAVRILRSALLVAAPSGAVTAAHILRGERELRQDLESALTEPDWQALADVHRTGRISGDPRLVVGGAVLPHEGPERRVWKVHPLLRPLVAEWTRAS